jgi:glycosyltransferase involved in cell wall biosynthesis
MTAAGADATPWLTVIMPSYRGEPWIDLALASIAAEADAGVEVLLIDGGPTAAARDIASRYVDRLNLKIFDRPDFRSWHDKTNFGVASARADHVCWLHVDDLWLPGRAAAARAWIEAAPHVSLHLAPCAMIDRDGRTLGAWRCPLPANCELDSAVVMERLIVQNFIAAPAPIFRKDAWLACGGLDESLWFTADWDMWFKLVASGPVYYHDDVTTAYRAHGSSLTSTGSRDINDYIEQLRIVLDRHLPRLDNPPKIIERTARASIGINAALAAAYAGNPWRLPRALFDVLRLGPSGIHRYLRDSRIVDRLAPRVKAVLRGTF